MKKLLVSAALLFTFSSSIFAQGEELRGGGVTAPSISDKDNWENSFKGDIILDTSDNNFYGLDNTGTWRNISAVSTEASPSTSGYVTNTDQTFGGNKTFNGSITPAGGIVGKTDGAPIAQGLIGEKKTATLSDTTFAATGTGFNVTGGSITLTPGVWMAFLKLGAAPPSSTWTLFQQSISTISATLQTPSLTRDQSTGVTNARFPGTSVAYFNVSSDTTIYAVASADYTGTAGNVASAHSQFFAIRIQ
ncbi:hypothetical protein [Oligoflexus tunisiensis]|uniref:hypothetical protein n=1 Tax=Oligoflexus tunisiensis TaxID=708132 RepID=UPI00114C87FE|nr:hypothetical protein [Oligoflexus tunisiensis]